MPPAEHPADHSRAGEHCCSCEDADRLTTRDGNTIAYDLNGSMATELGQAYI
jgi:hypothetical protein